MTISEDTIEDVYNLATSQIDEWLSEGMQLFISGPLDRAADSLWSNQSDEVKETIRQQQPRIASVLDNIRKRGI